VSWRGDWLLCYKLVGKRMDACSARDSGSTVHPRYFNFTIHCINHESDT
jgi:hypothetical protein